MHVVILAAAIGCCQEQKLQVPLASWRFSTTHAQSGVQGIYLQDGSYEYYDSTSYIQVILRRGKS